MTLTKDASDTDEEHTEMVRGTAQQLVTSAGQATNTTTAPFEVTIDIAGAVERIMTEEEAAAITAAYATAESVTTSIMTQFFGKKCEVCAHVKACAELKSERTKAMKPMIPPKKWPAFFGLDVVLILMPETTNGFTPEMFATVVATDKVLYESIASGSQLLFVGQSNAHVHSKTARVEIDHCFLPVDGVIRYVKLTGTKFGG